MSKAGLPLNGAVTNCACRKTAEEDKSHQLYMQEDCGRGQDMLPWQEGCISVVVSLLIKLQPTKPTKLRDAIAFKSGDQTDGYNAKIVQARETSRILHIHKKCTLCSCSLCCRMPNTRSCPHAQPACRDAQAPGCSKNLKQMPQQAAAST